MDARALARKPDQSHEREAAVRLHVEDVLTVGVRVGLHLLGRQQVGQGQIWLERRRHVQRAVHSGRPQGRDQLLEHDRTSDPV